MGKVNGIENQITSKTLGKDQSFVIFIFTMLLNIIYTKQKKIYSSFIKFLEINVINIFSDLTLLVQKFPKIIKKEQSTSSLSEKRKHGLPNLIHGLLLFNPTSRDFIELWTPKF